MNDILVKENGEYQLRTDIISTIYNIETEIKELKKLQDSYKEELLKAMQNANCINITNDKFTISYVSPTTREVFDSKTFQKEHKLLYDSYLKLTPIKSSVRIKLKEE